MSAHPRFCAALALSALALPITASAGNIAQCEAVIMAFVPDEAGGGADIASFRDATEFMMALYGDDTEPMLEIDGVPIRAIMCERNNLVPDADDYAILATGIPLSISQDFDSNETDSLTIAFVEGKFRYRYNSAYPISDEMESDLKKTLADFTKSDHGLGDDGDAQEDAEVSSEAVEPAEDVVSVEDGAVAEDVADTEKEIEADAPEE